MFIALLAGKELINTHNHGILKLENGNMIFINKRWQYMNPTEWSILEKNEDST